ncbi:type VI secretion system baseplate subunit TssG [Aerolutibacter ruishenii]|uniref:Type VI secretion system protein ImpH n=1 Tax=Aerolutibacter ruishenii TaxID=686800 RepID=A0A562M0L4_9GAMM|nr:type VI secretion system baseplate subunit TssG [Lysobacter ruishenii]TWI13383.1 type VI secretion system protein ImpH [Lysobacter ruishenii]
MRRIDPGVAQQLLAQPQRFGFFQAMRVLERLFVRQGLKPAEAVPARVRFRNSMSLGFPASEIESVTAYAGDGVALDRDVAVAHAITMEELGEVHLTPAFMGLLGGHGALPLHYTETLAEREVFQRDRAARAFLDIFSTRAVALHFAGWKKHRPALQYELDNRERFLPLVLALAGVGMPALRERLCDGDGDVFDQALAHHAGLLGQRPVSLATLQRVLADYFDVPLRVEPFVGAWYDVPVEQRTRLGMGNARLGTSALAGERVWQRDLRVRLWIGPLDRRHFDDFLPGGKAAKALTKWLALLTGSTLEYEVRLGLKAECVQGMAMGSAAPRLGWDSYLCSQPATTPRHDTTYFIQTLH